MLIQSFQLKDIQQTYYREYIGNVTYWGILCIVKHTWNVWSLSQAKHFFFFLCEEKCYVGPCGGVMAFDSCFLVLEI